ncbi:MAG: hypothetical protein JSV51_05480 [Candidatus Bathyarchaeota archaeon]|nr:MAG: hypothetical protein JSV51_05480 [Candidatus Bathyarchaeota archaeon]
MQKIDHVLDILKDGKWHAIDEISKRSNLHEFKIKIIADFLAHFSFLEFDRPRMKAKLSKIFADFIRKENNN